MLYFVLFYIKYSLLKHTEIFNGVAFDDVEILHVKLRVIVLFYLLNDV